MSGFREELRVVPRTAWILAWLVYLCLATVLGLVSTVGHDPGLSKMPAVGKVFFAAGIPIFLFILVLLIGYVYADAKRRGMRYVMWTLLATFIPDAIGVILYFLLRDPLPTSCPRCSTLVKHGFAYCPQCGAPVEIACPQCRRAVERGWQNCAYCGTKLPISGPSQSAA
jgi:RNA polymerase subunit RPABC4/transcription elongation factor Spt4